MNLNRTTSTEVPPAILVVDDEPNVLKSLCQLLSTLGCRHVLSASSVAQALEHWSAHRESISVVITDFVMPEATGDRLVSHLLKEKPQLSVLFISGNDPYTLDSEVLLEIGRNFLQKPFTASALQQILRL